MKIIKHPSYDILVNPAQRNRWSMVESARLCYKSTGSGWEADSALLSNCVKNGHWTPIEMSQVKVRFLCDRGISHELVRHRIASFNQESTRYCNYSKDKFGNEITVVKPVMLGENSMEYYIWVNQCESAEKAYFDMLDLGVKPETARSVLPTSLATTIDIQANLREWYHIFNLRIDRHAHPDMRYMLHGVLFELNRDYPEIFHNLLDKFNPQIVQDFVAEKGNN